MQAVATASQTSNIVTRSGKTVWPRSCPRCHRGDMLLERGMDGWYRECVQCGHEQELRVVSNRSAANAA